jgi:hypothetical protein
MAGGMSAGAMIEKNIEGMKRGDRRRDDERRPDLTSSSTTPDPGHHPELPCPGYLGPVPAVVVSP